MHSTRQSLAEKLAILQGYLSHEARDRLSGLGGSEAAYKQALKRLKDHYGRRGVIRLAMRTALGELKPSQNYPCSFQKYADQEKFYLFDLSQVGETNNADNIDGIINCLKLEDRLAWNMERRLMDEKDFNLNTFGEWLTDRAATYQTDESIATSQRAAANDRTHTSSTRFPCIVYEYLKRKTTD